MSDLDPTTTHPRRSPGFRAAHTADTVAVTRRPGPDQMSGRRVSCGAAHDGTRCPSQTQQDPNDDARLMDIREDRLGD